MVGKDVRQVRTIENSSSMAMTTSTASSESRPRSLVKDEDVETWKGKERCMVTRFQQESCKLERAFGKGDLTLLGSTFSKVLRTSTTRVWMASLLRPGPLA